VTRESWKRRVPHDTQMRRRAHSSGESVVGRRR
jgi:hypothetical protein